MPAYLNRIATSVPPHDVHRAFVEYACTQLASDGRQSVLFRRLAELGQIDHRYSFFMPLEDLSGLKLDQEGFYVRGAFPTTAGRMARFEPQAIDLAEEAVTKLELGDDLRSITHLVVTCCTGFSAPGIDLQLLERFGLSQSVERTLIGFMGCYAAINGLKTARHIVRSEREAKVLLVNLELCSLHMKESGDLDQILSFFLFGDGCSASLVTSKPIGFELDSFQCVLAPEGKDLITWHIGDFGFDMHLSAKAPVAVRNALCQHKDFILGGAAPSEIDLWAVHPGGRSILDGVQLALDLPENALWASRKVLRDYGNMSSATVMFVLKTLLASSQSGHKGCAMAFGPGLTAETMRFHAVG